MRKLHNLIIYSGFISFVFLCVAVFLGITGLNFTIHKWVGISAFVFSLLHVGLIGYKNIKLKKSRQKALLNKEGGTR